MKRMMDPEALELAERKLNVDSWFRRARKSKDIH